MGQTGVRAPHHEDDGDSTMSLRGGVSYRCPVWTRSSHRKLVNTTLNETCRPFNRYSRPIRTLRYHPRPPDIRRSLHVQNERTKPLTDQRRSLYHHKTVNCRLHSRNSFVSTPHPRLGKPAEACVAKWQEQSEAIDSRLTKYDIHPKERLPSGHTLPRRVWRTANRVRSGQPATHTIPATSQPVIMTGCGNK